MIELLQTALFAVFAAGGAYAAVRVEIKYLQRDVGKLESRVDGLEERERGYGSPA